MRAMLVTLGLAVVVGFVLGSAPSARAGDQETAALAKAVQNPIANLVTLPIQANYNLNSGPYERTFFNLNVQPVIPFPGKKWTVISRTIIPVNSVPTGETESQFGIGDATLQLYMTPTDAGSFIWGVGPVIGLPTASNPELLGSQKFGLGINLIGLAQPGKWTIGALAQNVWSVAGDADRDDYSIFTLQYFINYNLGKGWALGTVPIVTANWDADSGNQWTVPWGLQVSKVTRFGNQPVNLLLGYYYNSKHPEGSADSQVRVQLNFMFPTKKG